MWKNLGFPLLHLALELVENLLDVPAVLLDDYQLVDWDFHLVGQVGVGGPVGGIGVGDATQDFSVSGADEAVTFEAVVARVGIVDEVAGTDGGGTVEFLPGEEVDSSGVLDVAPHAVVDADLVPRVNGVGPRNITSCPFFLQIPRISED